MHPHPLILLRHGETTWNREGRIQGHLNAPLTARGLMHARAQRKMLANITLCGFDLWCSPLERAVQTAEIALGAGFRGLRFDDRLREIDMGQLSGTMIPDHCRRDHAALQEWQDQAPGGEGFENLRRRSEHFLRELQGPAVVIGHGVSLSLLLGLACAGAREVQGGEGPLRQGVVYRVQDGKYTISSHSSPNSA